MKRVKIMLTAIGVLAVVGGAVAFKAKTVGSSAYCFTTAAAPAACSASWLNASFNSAFCIPPIRYRVTTNPAACNSTVTCTSVATGVDF